MRHPRANRTFDEIAIAPITLIGHPVAPIVETPGQQGALDVTISAQAAPPGLFARARSSMGGPATYEVTVTVKNRRPCRSQPSRWPGR